MPVPNRPEPQLAAIVDLTKSLRKVTDAAKALMPILHPEDAPFLRAAIEIIGIAADIVLAILMRMNDRP